MTAPQPVPPEPVRKQPSAVCPGCGYRILLRKDGSFVSHERKHSQPADGRKDAVHGVPGHKVTQRRPGDWGCTCGIYLGASRPVAREAQRVHSLELRLSAAQAVTVAGMAVPVRDVRTLRDRVLSRLVIDPESGCLLWTGSRNGGPKGARYGKVKVEGRDVAVHRLMFEWFVGPIPPGLTIDHVRDRGCRHHHCASPDHLEAVTQAENNRRRYEWERRSA